MTSLYSWLQKQFQVTCADDKSVRDYQVYGWVKFRQEISPQQFEACRDNIVDEKDSVEIWGV